MPVQFHVDPDFYDHPKTAGMSDAAFALWVRAGSYSVAKLTDGFITEAVLVHTLRSDTQVADELVERGLWRRRRGGYVFHEWSVRNLTRQRVEDHKRAERERKRSSRQSKITSSQGEINNEEPQATGQTVRPDTQRNPSGRHPDSTPGYGDGFETPRGTDQDHSDVVEGGPGGTPPRQRGGPHRATRIPEDFAVTPEMVTWARNHTPHVDGRYETDQFCDYWRAKPGKDALKLDWVLTWQNWMRKAEKQASTRARSRPVARSGIDESIAAFEALKDHPDHRVAGWGSPAPPVLSPDLPDQSIVAWQPRVLPGGKQ